MPVPSETSKRFELEALEPRVLLSGEVVVAPTAGLDALAGVAGQVTTAAAATEIPLLAGGLANLYDPGTQLESVFAGLSADDTQTPAALAAALDAAPDVEAHLDQTDDGQAVIALTLTSPLAGRLPIRLTPEATGLDELTLDGTAEASGSGTLRLGLVCGLRNDGGLLLGLDPARSSVMVELDAHAPAELRGVCGGEAVTYAATRLDLETRWDVAFTAPGGQDSIPLDALPAGDALWRTSVSGHAALSAELVGTLRAANGPPARIVAVWTDLGQPGQVSVSGGDDGEGAAGRDASGRAAPDIVIESVTVPATVGINESLHVAWVGRNQGDAVVPGLEADGLWLSRDDILDRDSDYNLGQEDTGFATYWNDVPADGTYELALDITIPVPGTWYLFVEGDNWNDHAEGDEDNNFSLPQQVEVTGAGVGPDLVPQVVTAPAAAAVNESFTVEWTVANLGDVAAAGEWRDGVYLSSDEFFDGADRRLALDVTEHSPLLPEDGPYTLSQNLQIPFGGDWYLLFVTDVSLVQIEGDEDNNVAWSPLAIAGGAGPNLEVINSSAPAAGLAGETLHLTYDVQNTGDVDALSAWNDYIIVSSDTTPQHQVAFLTSNYRSAGLAADAEYHVEKDVKVPGTLAAGDYYILFYADGSGGQMETDDNDNWESSPLSITIPDVDLTVTMEPIPASLAYGATIAITWTVTNHGTEAATGDWSDGFYFSQDTIPTGNWPDVQGKTSVSAAAKTPLAGGDSYTVTNNVVMASWQGMAAGDWYFYVKADSGGVQGESNKANNFSEPVPVTINGVDLNKPVVTAPASAAAGTVISVTWTSKNIGNMDATATWHDRIYLSDDDWLDTWSDTLLGEVPAPSEPPLGPGQTYELTADVTLPIEASGTQYLIVMVNGDNALAEMNRSWGTSDYCNDGYSIIDITPAPADLVVTQVTVPEGVTPGQTVDVDWFVQNNGRSWADADWRDVVFYSLDDVLDGTDIEIGSVDIIEQSPMPPPNYYRIILPVTLPADPVARAWLFVVTDADDVQTELDETNNSYRVELPLDTAGPNSA